MRSVLSDCKECDHASEKGRTMSATTRDDIEPLAHKNEERHPLATTSLGARLEI